MVDTETIKQVIAQAAIEASKCGFSDKWRRQKKKHRHRVKWCTRCQCIQNRSLPKTTILWNTQEKYIELKNFKVEVIFSNRYCDTSDAERLAIIKDTKEITSEQVISWMKRRDAQHSHKTMLESLKETEEFNKIRKSNHRLAHI